MAKKELTISNPKLVADFFKAATTEDLTEVNISFAPEYARLRIHIKGEGFNSTLTPSIMKGFLSLQDMIYRQYSLLHYGCIKRLTAEERKMLEFTVIVSEGSTDTLVDLVKSLGNMVIGMESKHKLAAVAIAGVLTAGWALGTKYIDYKKEIETAHIEHEATVEMLNNIKASQDAATQLALEDKRIILEMQNNVYNSAVAVYSALKDDDIENLEINGNTVTKADIAELTRIERKKYELEENVYSGQFNISAIYRENNNVYIDAKQENSGLIIAHINILADFISANDYNWLKNAVEGKPVEMTITTTEKNNKIISAVLHSFRKE
ncbi:hypothetical protein [Treponema sp. UBA6852]|uniref:hypothetical protein n=1 Tax=Treponema sp. UBA6852 TaxID=1947744 RepID=UPI0025CEAF6F|nr:hypothetical protein [Treponema sp. UBA6852]